MTSDKLLQARQFRKEPTEAEQKAWDILRNRRMINVKFRRQAIIEGYVVDFLCMELRLVIEIDGGIHKDQAQAQYDAERSKVLEAKGLRIVRIKNENVNETELLKAVFGAS
jgi:very-short-patch-repair endonuclease